LLPTEENPSFLAAKDIIFGRTEVAKEPKNPNIKNI